MTHVFRSTNESLDAIVQSMQLTRNDNVLTILGSGDQALAMLEYARLVVAIDNIPEQAKYAQKQAALISEGNFEKFLARKTHAISNSYMRMQKYFKTPGRLEAIKKRIKHLRIIEGDIFKDSPGNKFSRIYLSNALGYLHINESPEQNMRLLVERLKPNGLLYVAEVNSINRMNNYQFDNMMERNEELTGIARLMERGNEIMAITRRYQSKMWNPAVYRRRT